MPSLTASTLHFVTELGTGFIAGGDEESPLLMCQWGCNDFIIVSRQEG